MKSKGDSHLGQRVLLAAALFVSTSTLFAAAPPVVSNVRAAQRPGTKLVDIYYDVADPDSATLAVSVAVSTNGGASYSLPAASFSGSGYGSSVTPGSNKQIVWNAGADWNGKFSANVRFQVSASDDTAPSGMVLIPAGSFTMGNAMSASEGYPYELPLHSVYVSAFYMDRYDATKALWDQLYSWATNHGYGFDWADSGQGKAANHPAHTMTWYDAVKWCNARSEKEGLVPAYYTEAGLSVRYRSGQLAPYVNWSSGYRLPTEAEWEKAARGGASGQRFPWGNTISWSQANYYGWPLSAGGYAYDVNPTQGDHPTFNDGVIPYTSPVDYFAPNGLGLYDMAGNVWQWCWDWYGAYSGSAQSDPRGPATDSSRVLRGAGWRYAAINCRAAMRSSRNPTDRNFDIGFRSVLSPGQSDAATSTGISPVVTVDTRDAGISVSGRVLDKQSHTAISGATVTLAGQSTSSSGAGLFSFASVSLSSGNTLAVSKSGYATYAGTVPAPAGATAVTVPDILLSATTGGVKPVVTGLQAQRDGMFLGGIALLNDFTATVDWQGRTPSKIYFYVNGALVATKTTSGTEATATLDMGLAFSASFGVGSNKLKVVAEDAIGVTSNPYEITVRVIPLPALLTGLPASIVGAQAATYSFDVTYPSDKYPVKALQTIPFLGDFGWDLQFIGGYEYALDSGEWTLYAGVQPAKSKGRRGERPHSSLTHPKFYVGNRDIDFGVKLQADGTATQTGGIVVNEAGVVVFVEVKQELLSFYLSDYVPGAQWVRILDRLKWLGVDVNSVQRVSVYGLFNGEFQLMVQFQPPPTHFNGADISLELGLEAAYEPDLKVAKMRIYVGGKVKGEFEIPYSPFGFKVNSITGKVYGGVSIESWIFEMKEEFVIVQGTLWTNTSAMQVAGSPLLGTQNQTKIVLPAGHRDFGPRPRDYLEAGPERFLGFDGAQATTTAKKRTALLASVPVSGTITPLDEFRSIGIPQPPGGPVDGAGPQIAQADLVLVQNVFPGSDPAMAGRSNELMLLYVTDNGSPNNLQFTDIRWTRFDGTNWSVPATIQTNTQAEFAPQVAYDGNGDAIAVWERVADPNFNQMNLAAMAAQMEIVWSKWNHTSGDWSTPVPLTSNGYLDHAPLLCGPMTDGSVLATWSANTSNLLMGTNGAGSQVLWAQWNPGSQSWSSPQTLLTDLPNRLSQSLSGVSNLAVYAWTRDLDGVLTNANDQQVFYSKWSNGVWSAATQFTTSTNGNRNARVSVGSDGHNYLVWQSGTNLVLSKDFSTNTTLVRADSQTAGFADYAMTIGPAGNLALLWQEMSQAGSDAHYRVLDPASATWSKDAQLFDDPPLERSFAPVWDDVGNLTVAYNKVDIIYTNKTVTLEGGGTVTITNVPQPGRVDLWVTKRRLIKDVALGAGDFTASAENYLPGAAVTLSATLRNVGDLAVSNAVVGFYDGNPTNGGVLITNVAISGWLEGAATNTVSALWVVPDPATNHVLYAVADPANVIAEFNETNNTQSLSIGGTDLSVSLVSQTAETNGALRVIAQVQNLGAPSATNSVLAIRRYGNTNASLATVAVPLLEPGRLAQVALDLPAGTQPEGEALYTLHADETSLTSDVDTNNNTTSFAVNLWIDSDGDGMPDNWMMQYFGHATGQAGDLSRAQDDADGDGVSNLAEYRAGTNPRDPLSYLRIQSLAVGGTNGVQVVWGSTTNRLYTVQRASVLGLGFSNVAEHILSTPPQNTYLDTTATNANSFFYRIKVE